jgi:hypothetical protein
MPSAGRVRRAALRARRGFPPRAKRGFSTPVLNTLSTTHIIGIRAGRAPHRFIAVWVVVVGNRAFVRSWFVTQRSWYHVFVDDPRGAIQLGKRTIGVRAVPIHSERVKKAVDAAYGGKYRTPASRRWVRGFKRPKSRNTTIELVPAAARRTR